MYRSEIMDNMGRMGKEGVGSKQVTHQWEEARKALDSAFVKAFIGKKGKNESKKGRKAGEKWRNKWLAHQQEVNGEQGDAWQKYGGKVF